MRERVTTRLGAALLLAASLALPARALRAGELLPAPEGVDAGQIALLAENNLRADRTRMQLRMTVESPRLPLPRVVTFRTWDDRPGKRNFVRIDSPSKDAGTGFLKLHPNLWMWVPRVERTMRIPPSMMLQSWMGSDFTNDDLVRESSEIEDYDHRMMGVDPDPPGGSGSRAYVIEYLPHEEAPVVWARIVAWVDVERNAPLRQEFYDEEGVKLRVISYGGYREVDGRWFPHDWSLDPLDKPGHSTRIEIESVEFEPEIPDSLFTTRNLKRSR